MPETAPPPPNDGGGVDPTDVDIAEAFQPPDNLDHTPDPLAAAKPPPVDEPSTGGTAVGVKEEQLQEHINEKAAEDEEQEGDPEEATAGTDRLAEGPTKTEEDEEMAAVDLPVEEQEMPMEGALDSHRHSNINSDYAGAATGVWNEEERRQFEQGIVQFGWSSWKMIQTLIPTRSVKQIKSHAQKFLKNHPETKTRLIQMHEARERGEPIPELHALHPAGFEGDADLKTDDGLSQTEGEMSLEPPRKKARRINRKSNATGGKGEWTVDEKKQFHLGIIQYGWGNWKEIIKYIPSRTKTQLKSHAQKFLLNHPDEKASLHAQYLQDQGHSDAMMSLAPMESYKSATTSKAKVHQRWTRAEQKQFAYGCILHGWGNWVMMEREIPSRTWDQIQYFAGKLTKSNPDEKDRLVKEHHEHMRLLDLEAQENPGVKFEGEAGHSVADEEAAQLMVGMYEADSEAAQNLLQENIAALKGPQRLEGGAGYHSVIVYQNTEYSLGSYTLASDAAHAYDEACRILGVAESDVNFATHNNHTDLRETEMASLGVRVDLQEALDAISVRVKEAMAPLSPGLMDHEQVDQVSAPAQIDDGIIAQEV